MVFVPLLSFTLSFLNEFFSHIKLRSIYNDDHVDSYSPLPLAIPKVLAQRLELSQRCVYPT